MRLLVFTILIFTGFHLIAQQRPYYTQYVLNQFINNPAIAGIENYIDVKGSIRNQWIGIKGAPKASYITIHAPIGKADDKMTSTSLPMQNENPIGRYFFTDYVASPPHHGVGLQVFNFSTGYINRSYATANYAYHIGINSKTNLSAGFGAGMSMIAIDRSKIDLAQPGDPILSNGTNYFRKLSPELNAGLWLYHVNYFLGISAMNIIPENINLSSVVSSEQSRFPHLLASAGVRLFLTDDITFLPSGVVKYINGFDLYKDVNIKFQYRYDFWVGASYRFSEGYAAMAGFNISSNFNFGYAYDFNNQLRISGLNKGTHEIVLGFLLKNKYGAMCPKHVW